MKKLILSFLIFFTSLSFFIHAEEEIEWRTNDAMNSVVSSSDKIPNNGWKTGAAEDTPISPDEYINWNETLETVSVEKLAGEKVNKPSLPVENRVFELGIANLNLGVSNSFLSVGEVFKEVMQIDLDKLNKGLKLNINLFLDPINMDINIKDKWGFGIHTGIDVMGNIGLSGNLLSLFGEAENDLSDLNAAAFVEVRIPVFFQIDKIKLKVKFKPALYYPLLYAESNISYTYKNITNSDKTTDTLLYIKTEPRIYTGFSLEDVMSGKFQIGGPKDIFNMITSSPGIDINMEFEYPLSEEIGLSKKIPFLDFNVGVGLYGVPLFPSTMKNYAEMKISVGSEDPLRLDILNMGNSDMDDFFSMSDFTYGKKNRSVYRPFKFHAWANWKPFESKIYTFTPTFGFAINPLFIKKFSFEGGLKASINLSNLFIFTAGIGYYDRVWKNSLDFVLFNIRAFELDLGISSQSADFLKSWIFSGVGVNFAVKMGW